MDPVSISASIAGLVSLADLVFRSGTRYVRAVRDSRKEVEELLQEVKNLSLLLHSLSLAAFDLEVEAANSRSDDTTHSSNLKPHHLFDCQQVLRRLDQGLSTVSKDFESRSSLVRLQRRLKWPFSSDETKNVLQSIQRHKETINIALASDSMANMKLCLSRQEKVNEDVEDLKLMATKILDIETKISLDHRRRRVLKLFTSFDPRSEFETSKNLRHPMTTLWLTEGSEFDTWYSTPCSKLWCSGIPGAGKSIIAGAMISECLSRSRADPHFALAYVFCTYRNPETHDPIAILSSLAAQLAQQGESAYGVLEAYYNELHSDQSIPAKPTADALIGVLNQICSTYTRVFIIIDGLDECGSQARANVRSLTKLARTQSHETINIALLSRDELYIRQQLEDSFECIHLEAHTEDIQLYVASELDRRINAKELRLRDITLKDHILTILVNGAKGMFRWVACQLDHICELPTDRSRREALSKLPPTLFDTYERILLRIQSQDNDVQDLVQKSLRIISSPFFTKLTAQEICEAVSVPLELDTFNDDDTIDEAEILHWCGSLVRKTNDGQMIEFSHYTVQEYLTNICPTHPRLSTFGTSDEQVNELLASICLRYLTLKDHERLPQANEDEITYMLQRRALHPFYEKAATIWPQFVFRRSRGPCAQDLGVLFNPNKTASFCLWAIELILHCAARDNQFGFHEPVDVRAADTMTMISAVMRPDFTPLHMAATLGLTDVCSNLLQQGADLNIRSQFGTPLHCAIGHLTVFVNKGISGVYREAIGELQPYGSLLASARRRTTVLLLEAGARSDLYLNTPFRVATVLSLPVLATTSGEDFEIVVDLIEAGITVDEQDLENFQSTYRHVRSKFPPHKFKQEYHGGKAFTNLLETLATTGSLNSTQSRLYAMTLEFVKHMELDLPLLPDRCTSVDMLETYNFEKRHSYLVSVIEKNDVIALNLILQSNRSTLVETLRSKSEQGWTCFHIAVASESLNVLEALLKHGFNPNIPAADGRTPVRLCEYNADEDMLRAFLRSGCSTIIPDNDGLTVWHASAKNGSPMILKILLELDDRDTALQMKSQKNTTPVFEALEHGYPESTLLLLPFCNARSFWPSEGPVFRSAAKMGSSEVLEKLLEIDFPLDVVDNVEGNPLHDLSPLMDLKGVEILKKLFPMDQRRQKDFKTPLELLLLRSSETDVPLHDDVFEAILEETLASNPSDSSLLWSFVCSDILPDAIECWPGGRWDRTIVSFVIQKGVARLYEETQKTSPVLPFASAVIEIIDSSHKRSMEQLWADGESRAQALSPMSAWSWISAVILKIAKDTQLFSQAVNDSSVVRLLSESIIHDDGILLSFLLEAGVDVHERENDISSFELACLPDVDLSSHNFELILKYSKIEKASQRNELFDGYGPLHLTAGFSGSEGSVWKLERLVKFGLDCDSPMDDIGRSPILFHISERSLNTAETLLDLGADPCIADEDGWDAPLTAITRNYSSLLKRFSAIFEKTSRTPNWERTFTEVFAGGDRLSGGNALHMSLAFGNLDCLKFYLDRNLIRDLESLDKNLQTPMHYAARFGHSSAIKLLAELGGDLTPTDRSGKTPLHFAAQGSHLKAVEVLIDLGAEIKACSAGCTPLVYAYMSGSIDVIKAIDEYEQRIEQETKVVSDPKVARMMAKAMVHAIQGRDLDACKGLLQGGCPVDIELNFYGPVTPLMATICTNGSQPIVQYFLDMGATTSTVYDPPYRGTFFTTIEAALAHGRNDILPALMQRYFQEGPNLNRVPRSPLHIALTSRNFAGCKVLLDFIKEAQQPDKNSQTTILDASMHTFVLDDARSSPSGWSNQCNRLADYGTPLHLAARIGHVEVTRALIETTNSLEDIDLGGRTPLHLAAITGATEVVELLLNHGSHEDALMSTGDTPLMLSCINNAWHTAFFFLERSSGNSVRRANYIGDTPLSLIAGITGPLTTQNFHKVLNLGLDLYGSVYDGMSAAYRLLLGPVHTCLRYLMDQHPGLLAPNRIHLPSSWMRALTRDRLPHLVRGIRLLSRRHYAAEELRNIAGLAATVPGCPQEHNPLCQAARYGCVGALRDFGVIWGPSIYDLRCCDHGTLFDAAIACREIEVIKFLIRDCAVDVTLGRAGRSEADTETNVLHNQDIDSSILRWLLVERYMDQTKLTFDETDLAYGTRDGVPNQTREHATDLPSRDGTDCEMAEPTTTQQTQKSRWAHTVIVQLPFEWRQRRDETMWQYAIRRRAIVRSISEWH